VDVTGHGSASVVARVRAADPAAGPGAGREGASIRLVPARESWLHAPAVFQVSQSATGQFVVIHPASNTVMVGDDLAATYEQMRAFVAGLGHVAAGAAPVAGVAAEGAAAGASLGARLGATLGSSAAHWVLLAALALLPFVWLGALHVSLGRLVAELRVAPPAAGKEQFGADLRARVERVERQIESIERPGSRTPGASAELQADNLEQQAEQADDGPEPEKAAGEAGEKAGEKGPDKPSEKGPEKARDKGPEKGDKPGRDKPDSASR
jgi:hypothetical protein